MSLVRSTPYLTLDNPPANRRRGQVTGDQQQRTKLAQRLACLLLVVFVAMPAAGQEQLVDAKVVHVSDGDTVVVITDDRQRLVVRLRAIDAPEKNREGRPGQAYAEQSRLHLARLVRAKPVRLMVSGTDDYGRVVARVWVHEVDAGQAQVCAGFAWVYERFVTELPVEDQRRYRLCQQRAQKDKVGLWQDADAIPPWTWRHKRD